ncbi:MAG: ABC transporter ATP-binding protein [Clostridia bacterium]|nr:ABC transporter ATP-binding protein [Clostridia bacterium]
MREYYPLLVSGAIIGVFSLGFLVAFLSVKDKKEVFGFERHMKDSEIIRRLFKYAKPYWKNFLLAFFLMLLAITYDILSPIIVGETEELIKDSFELGALFKKVGIYAGILVVSVAGTYIQAILLQKTGQKIISEIRSDLFKHIESLSHAQLHSIPVGTLVTRVTNDTNSLSRMFTNVIINLVQNFLVIFGVLAAMLALNLELTLMILCFVPFIVLFTVIFRKFSRRAFRKVKDATTGINVFLAENLSGMKLTQIFNRTERKIKDFDERNDKSAKAKMEEIFVFSTFRPSVYMLYIASVLCLFYLGGKGYLGGGSFMGSTITGGVIVSFYMFTTKFFNPIQNLAEQFNVLQSAFASAEKIFTILDVVPAVVDEPDAIDVDRIEGNIEFEDVWFKYVEDEWVLKGVSFKVNAGDTVAFVGATGSGKSTILSLICRNYDVQKGRILIDGIDIKKIKISSLRRHFGQMMQDVFLFAGTVRSNIVLYEDKTDEEVMEACRFVNADKFIGELEHGIYEEVRERSNNFSAGQRQLLSFARMIIHRPEVMILDEATANIDAETELLIQNSLEKMMNVGTMLIVAHRLSTVQHADKIIVLSHGEIVEEGNHFDLIGKKGRYYDLYTLQYEKQRLAAQ